MNVILACLLLFVEVFQLPDSLPVALRQPWVRLLDNNDIRKLMPTFLHIILVVLQLLHVQLIDIIPQDRVIVVDELTKMSVYYISLIIDTEVGLSGNLELNHFELLPCSSARCIDIKIYFFDVEHNEAGQKFL